jgi:hypothetical protein
MTPRPPIDDAIAAMIARHRASEPTLADRAFYALMTTVVALPLAGIAYRLIFG